MQLKDAIKEIKGFREWTEELELVSGVARSVLYASPWKQQDELEKEFARIAFISRMIEEKRTVWLEKLRMKISQVWDIRPTFGLLGLSRQQDAVLDDVQFFEIKRFALLAAEISQITREIADSQGGQDLFYGAFPSLEEVIRLLDPRNERVPSFYIYDEYSPELSKLRHILDGVQLSPYPSAPVDTQKISDACAQEEYQIRTRLSADLAPFKEALEKNMDNAALWDILLAKAYQVQKHNLCRPEILSRQIEDTQINTSVSIAYEGLFHPWVKQSLEEKGHRFQAWDICLYQSPCLLTGANMSGKTVLLKTLALAQYLCQFGFYVPALHARMKLFDEVCLLSGDEQDELAGLSSFGSEIRKLHQVLEKIKSGKKVFLLADELARTTNPEEGGVLVAAVVDFLADHASTALVSTHYGHLDTKVRRLRVKGFSYPNEEIAAFSLPNLQDYMDYSLAEENTDAEPPAEALRIAALLGFHDEVLEKALEKMEKRKQVGINKKN